jgi:Ca2+-dependent lipid-binding protein
MDLLGKIDAFVTVYAGRNNLCSTKVIPKDYNPIWNHICPTVALDSFGEGFRFDVYDYDKVKNENEIELIDMLIC